MNTYGIIEPASGYVWWIGKADTPLRAIQQMHYDIKDDITHYDIKECSASQSPPGYTVYQVTEENPFDHPSGDDESFIKWVVSHQLVARYSIELKSQYQDYR